MGSSTASAHHAFAAEFDANRPVNFTGTITKMEWVNPHCWLHIANHAKCVLAHINYGGYRENGGHARQESGREV
jgi:hypothetical protein